MKVTLRIALALAVISILTPCRLVRAQGASNAAKASAKQSELLQGTWEGFEVGREALGKCVLTISGDSIHFQGANKDEWYKADFTLPTGTDPNQLRVVIKDCPVADFIGKSAVAIFRIQDGALTLVGHPPGSSDAPKSFEGDATSRSFIFKKAKS
jgi:uncharacterized protein (TIGR03067 family)